MSIDDAKKRRKSGSAKPATKGTKPPRKRYRSPQRRIVVGLIQFGLVTYLAILLGLIGLETRLIYPGAYMDGSVPARGLHASILPSATTDGQLAAQEVAQPVSNAQADGAPSIQTVPYETTDGLTIRGRLLERGPDKPIVLYLHGNGIKAAWMDSWIQELSQKLDANVLAAEYRGFDDDQTPTEKGVLADCLSARRYLCDRYQVTPKDIIVYGESLGGGCAVAVASNGGAKVLILDRTFDRLIDVAANRYPFLPVRRVIRNRYDSIAKLTAYRDPLICIHGTNDEVIPMEHGRRLYDSSRSEKKLWIQVEGLGHMDPLPPETWRELTSTLASFTANEP